jgi:Rrf2 family protein
MVTCCLNRQGKIKRMLSKKSQYAFKALMYLAQNTDKGPVLIAEIARKKKIPLKFLENILLELKKAGVLESKKGKGGGYYFAVPPSQVPMAKIMRLLDGPIALLPCVSLNFYERCKNCDEKSCGLHDMMINVRDVTLKVLEKRTVADIARK